MDEMDEDTSLRTPATSHSLDPDVEENVPKKARVVSNVLHIRGEDELKFDANGQDWLNAELAVRSSYEGALNDGLPADKVKAGDEREITQVKDLQLYSWIREGDVPPGKSILLTSWARRMKGNEMSSRCALKDFATTVRDNVFAPTPSPVSVRGFFCTQLGTISVWRLETLCARSCEQTLSVLCLLDLRKGQEKEGCI